MLIEPLYTVKSGEYQYKHTQAVENKWERCTKQPCCSFPKLRQCPHNFRPAVKVYEPVPVEFAEGEQRKLTMERTPVDGYFIQLSFHLR